MRLRILSALLVLGTIAGAQTKQKTPFVWEGANLYFLLVDRFNNGDPSNDVNFERTKEAAVMRGFKGGDIRGIIQKIDEGYFDALGINAIWLTPIVEQIHDGVDEGDQGQGQAKGKDHAAKHRIGRGDAHCSCHHPERCR